MFAIATIDNNENTISKMVGHQLTNNMFVNNGERNSRTGYRNSGFYSVQTNYRWGIFGDKTAYPIPPHRIALKLRVVDLTGDDDDIIIVID
jgi:hypothetical protein